MRYINSIDTMPPMLKEVGKSPTQGEPAGIRSPLATARDLSEATRILREFEGTALAAVAETLMRVAEVQARTLAELAGMGADAILTVEQAAAEMGYVDEEGNPRTKAFAKAAAEKGFRRHVLNANNIYYLRRELHEDVERLPG